MEQFERIRRDARDDELSIRALANKHNVHRRTVRAALAGQDRDRGDLIEPEQPGQMDCVLRVSLDPLARRLLQFEAPQV